MSQSRNVYLTRKIAAVLCRRMGGDQRAVLQRIQFTDGFAYATDRFIIARWDLRGLNVPDGSWIDLAKPEWTTIPNEKFNADGSLYAWLKLAGSKSTFDLMDESRWREPDENSSLAPHMSHLFKLPSEDEPFHSVSFSPLLLEDLVEIVSEGKQAFQLRPTGSEMDVSIRPWWLLGDDGYADGLITPMRFNHDDPYVKPVEEKKDAE